ncbi:MAG: hypothetical protein KGO03_08900 [Gemmatimonadota bacterium]|nr:hypothetical protein [Gemmatimonadota bacterium]MDE3216504.1 hypothetical protein [Gemmatimonadota bacterium]
MMPPRQGPTQPDAEGRSAGQSRRDDGGGDSYRSPKLTRFGPLRELTANGGTVGKTDHVTKFTRTGY